MLFYIQCWIGPAEARKRPDPPPSANPIDVLTITSPYTDKTKETAEKTLEELEKRRAAVETTDEVEQQKLAEQLSIAKRTVAAN
eukprot:SAG22_NODE_2497_length_2510_cov_1.882621_1_plen_83_part_10